MLVDMETADGGEYDQKIRTVQTHLADATAKNGDIDLRREMGARFRRPPTRPKSNDLGMAIEHKPAGKYDSEAERVAQPAGFAYVAPPAQGSNQYGYWDHRDGRDFWVFYGQYALMRDLLFNHQYRPLDRYEWEGYRTYQSRGQTYYGRTHARATARRGTARRAVPPRSATPEARSPRAEASAIRSTRPRAAPMATRNTPRPAATARRGNSAAAAGRKTTAPARPRVPRRGRRTGRPARLEDSVSTEAIPRKGQRNFGRR